MEHKVFQAARKEALTINQRGNSAFLGVVLVSVAAGLIGWWSMASGIGVSPDSVVYLSAADSLLAGQGLKPIVHHFTPVTAPEASLAGFPPVYPLLLSFSGALSSDRLNGARWLHSLLFAFNVFLLGVIVSVATARSTMATLLATLLFVSAQPIIEIHTMAWSEALFILFALSAFLLLLLHIREANYLYLFGASTAAGLALMTRYGGVIILPAMALTILLLEAKPLRNRILDSTILAGTATIPLTAWLIHNELQTNSAISRAFVFHPTVISDLKKIGRALLTFWLPITSHFFLNLILLLLGAGLAASFALLLKDVARQEQGARGNSASRVNSAAILFASVAAIIYPLLLVAHNSFIGPVVSLDTRTLLPAAVLGIIAIVSFVYRHAGFKDHNRVWQTLVTLLCVLISLNMVSAFTFVNHRHSNSIGYASREWTGSETIAYTRAISDDRTIYSNGIDAIYFLTKQKALRIPAKVDPVTGKDNAAFQREMNSLHQELVAKRALVVFFNNVTWRWYLPAKAELESIYNLPVMVQLHDGTIYGVR